MDIKMFILGLLTFIWGVTLIIRLVKESKEIFKEEELRIIFYSLLFMISISFTCAGLDIMFFG